MKFLFVFLIFGVFFIPAGGEGLPHQENSAVQWYNEGVQYYNSQEQIKAAAVFRKALQLDPWMRPAQKALDQLNHPPPFWLLIPSEFFLSLTALSLLFLCFSLRISSLLFFGLCLMSHFGFSFYRHLPRETILEKTAAHTAPHASSPVLFSLNPGDWVVTLKTSKEWIQIKTSDQTLGWISKIKLHPK